MHKIGIIGAGDIGFNLAEILAILGYDVIIYNRYHAVNNVPSPYWLAKMGKLMDMNDSLQLPLAGKVILTSNPHDLKGSSICVITAGAKRTSTDESREELASKNANILTEFLPLIIDNPTMLVMIISNPVDFLTQYLIEEIAKNLNKSLDEVSERIIGVTYVDTMRLLNLIKEFLATTQPELAYTEIKAIALGEHGPSMVPLLSSATIDNKLLSDYATYEQLEDITRQTILRGNDIIKLTGTSSIMGPAHAVMHMIILLLKQAEVTIPCSVWDGKRAIGKLVKFNNLKVAKIETPRMSDQEQQKMHLSESILDNQYIKIKNWLKQTS